MHAKYTEDERGVAGSDPSTRGRSPVVIEVLFHSRPISTRGIQSESVLGYLYYLGFYAVRSGVVHLEKHDFFSQIFDFCSDVRKLLGPRLFQHQSI